MQIVKFSYEEWEGCDEAHRIALLARNFARQWMGGMTTINSMSTFCFQEDVVEYLVTKVVKRVLKNARQIEQYLLANYVRIQIAESFLVDLKKIFFVTLSLFLAPGESIAMREDADQYTIETHCGKKGSQMLESLDSISGEESIIAKLRNVIRHQRYKNFDFEHFLELLRGQIIDNIDLAQVYEFWFKSGGIPNLLVEKRDERLRLIQPTEGRQAQINAGSWSQMSLWPLRISVRNISLPITFMLSQALELAPLDKKMLALTNVGYEHVYRVNYDTSAWEVILKNLEVEKKNPSLSARSRGQIGGGKVDNLRRVFFELLRDNYEQFELCEFYTFWCFGGFQRKINMDKSATKKYYDVVKAKVWPALWNNKNYECGGPSSANSAADDLCQQVFGVNCL